jgi:hypothetical protein
MNWRIILTHLGILVLYCAVIFAMNPHSGEESFGRAIFLAIAISAHVLVLLTMAVENERKSYVLSALLVLIIGFGFCTSNIGI